MKNCRNCGAPPSRRKTNDWPLGEYDSVCHYCGTYNITHPAVAKYVKPARPGFAVPDKVIVDYRVGASGDPVFYLGPGGTPADLEAAARAYCEYRQVYG